MWTAVGAIGGVLAAIGSIIAAVMAIRARSDSRAAAVASETSAEAAEGALELSRAEVARARERTDVQWDRQYDKARLGLVRYRNVGSTTAYNVTIALTVNDVREDLSLGDVAPGGTIEFDKTEVRFAAAVRADQRRVEAQHDGIGLIAGPRFHVLARITWTSELGTPAVVAI